MSKTGEFETFKETFKLVSLNPRKFEYRLKTQPFDPSEKRILQGLLALRRGDKAKAFQQVKCSAFSHLFLEAMRCYVLGATHLNFGTFRFAKEHLEKSMRLLEQVEEKEFILYPLVALAIAHANRQHLKEMGACIDKIMEYPSQEPYWVISRVNVVALYLSKTEQFKQALKLITQSNLKSNPFFEIFQPSFLIIKFNIHFKQGEYLECENVLEAYKEANGYRAKANYEYMKAMLDHIVYSKPLYVYARDFQDFPELFHQLEVIKNLSSGDMASAERFWKMLAHNNPQLYRPAFEFSGDSILFHKALTLYKGIRKLEELDPSLFAHITDNMDKLDAILKSSAGPVEKATLVKLIWNEEVSETSMARLRKLVSRYNQKSEQQICSRQQAYFLKAV